jgi:hypothetical protein
MIRCSRLLVGLQREQTRREALLLLLMRRQEVTEVSPFILWRYLSVSNDLQCCFALIVADLADASCSAALEGEDKNNKKETPFGVGKTSEEKCDYRPTEYMS